MPSSPIRLDEALILALDVDTEAQALNMITSLLEADLPEIDLH